MTALPEYKDHAIKGIAYALAAFFALAVMQLCGKLLAGHFDVIEIAFYRNAVSFVCALVPILVLRRRELVTIDKPLWLLARSAVGTTGLVFTFAAYRALPMADATVLIFTTSLIAPVLAWAFLKEHVGPRRWVAIAVGFCGAMLLAGPTGEINPGGLALALTAAGFQALVSLALRFLRQENPYAVAFYFVLSGMVFCGIAMPFVFTGWPTPDQYPLLLGLGVSGFAGQILLTSAYKYAPASLVSPMNYSGLIWATLFDILFWAYVPGWPVFAGGAIVIASSLFILWRERLAAGKYRDQAPPPPASPAA